MGKNTFQSLAIAASMLGMSANSATAQGSGDQIAETKGAIEALISSLPSEQFKAAITVLEWDKALLADGFLDGKDATAIRDHASKLLWISKDAAQKVLDSLNPRGVVPSTKEAGVVKKSEPPIGGYTKEQQAAIKEKERLEKISTKLLEEFNAEVMKGNSWSFLKIGAEKIDSEVTVKNSDGWLKFTMSKKNWTLGRATFHKDLTAWKYSVELSASEGKVMIWWEGGKWIFLTPGLNTFELPVGTGIDLCVFVNRLHPEVELKKFKISPAAEAAEVVAWQ